MFSPSDLLNLMGYVSVSHLVIDELSRTPRTEADEHF